MCDGVMEGYECEGRPGAAKRRVVAEQNLIMQNRAEKNAQPFSDRLKKAISIRSRAGPAISASKPCLMHACTTGRRWNFFDSARTEK